MSYIEIIIGLIVLFAINFFTSKKNKENQQNNSDIQMEDISNFEINTKSSYYANPGKELTKKIIKESAVNLSNGKMVVVFIVMLIIVGALYAFYTGEIPIDILRYLF